MTAGIKCIHGTALLLWAHFLAVQNKDVGKLRYRNGSFVLQTPEAIISITTRTAVRRGSHEWVPASLFDILPKFKPSVKGLSNAPCKPHDLKIWMTDKNKSRAFPLHAMMANKCGGGTIPLIINLRTIRRWVADFTHPDHLTPGYLINRKLGGPLSKSARFGRKNILPLPGFEPRSIHSTAQSLYRLPDAHTCCTKCENKVPSVPRPHNTELYVSWSPYHVVLTYNSNWKRTQINQ